MNSWGDQKVGLSEYLILLTLNYDLFENGNGYSTGDLLEMLRDIREDVVADDGRSGQLALDGRVWGLLLGMERRGLVRRSCSRQLRWHIRLPIAAVL